MGKEMACLWLILIFSNTNFTEKNCRLQRDSNSDCLSRRQELWPLNHHHGPNCYQVLVNEPTYLTGFYLSDKCLQFKNLVELAGIELLFSRLWMDNKTTKQVTLDPIKEIRESCSTSQKATSQWTDVSNLYGCNSQHLSHLTVYLHTFHFYRFKAR